MRPNVREALVAFGKLIETLRERAAEWSPGLILEELVRRLDYERFLAEAALLSGQDKEAGTEQGVTLMTMHTAKGLEWPVVAITGLEDGLLQTVRSRHSSP